jgi:predicted amidophosphoribosyltransferase
MPVVPDETAFGCPVCGQSLRRPGPCPNRWCARGDRWWSVVFAVGAHRAALRDALLRYKYRGERWRAYPFAQTVAGYLEAHATWFEEFDLVAGVPSYQGPGASRTWDPVGDILAALQPRLGSSWVVAPHAVIKRFETPRMQGRRWSQRQRIAAGPFRSALAIPDPSTVDGARVLVFDDVMTEGSTLREVARALRTAGADEVAGLVLSRPPWSD